MWITVALMIMYKISLQAYRFTFNKPRSACMKLIARTELTAPNYM